MTWTTSYSPQGMRPIGRRSASAQPAGGSQRCSEEFQYFSQSSLDSLWSQSLESGIYSDYSEKERPRSRFDRHENLRRNLHKPSRRSHSQPLQKSHYKIGTVWVMKEGIFSQWKERYFILDNHALTSCKKMADVGVSETGTHKIPMEHITSVSLDEKKGQQTLTVRCSDGAFHVRSCAGVQDWYDALGYTIRKLSHNKDKKKHSNPSEFFPVRDLEASGRFACGRSKKRRTIGGIRKTSYGSTKDEQLINNLYFV